MVDLTEREGGSMLYSQADGLLTVSAETFQVWDFGCSPNGVGRIVFDTPPDLSRINSP